MKKNLVSISMIFVLLFTVLAPPVTAQASTPATGGFLITNLTGQVFVVQVTGPVMRSVTTTTKKYAYIDKLPWGKYRYTFTVCDTTQTGTFELTAAHKAAGVLIKKCNKPAGKQAGPKVTVTLRNATGSPLEVILDKGPASYRYKLAPGDKRVLIVKGTYNYRLFGCQGERFSGKITIKKEFIWRIDCSKLYPVPPWGGW